MIENILVPLDGSDQSERIGRWAGGMAKGLGASLTLLAVPSPNSKTNGEGTVQAQESRDYLGRLADKLAGTGIETRVEVRPGKPAQTIVATAEELETDMIAVATRRASSLARSVLGSVTDQVLHNTTVPVMIANPDALIVSEQSPDVPSTLIVPLDGSPLSEKVIALTESFAQASGAEISYARIMQRAFTNPNDPVVRELQADCERYLEEFVSRSESAGLKAKYRIMSGIPAAEIMKAADEEKNAIIVMSTHGRTGFRRAVLGSVCDTVVRSARTPVLVLPAG
ncbi:MAG: universal stress protein [Chloroflexi bacterium]|nr:universal stress protein [Chloroflexota bacterium]